MGKTTFKIAFSFLGLLLFSINGFTQENPPIPIQVEVRTSQFLDFGAFTVGASGGNISVNYDGQRTANGDIFLLNLGNPPSPALFDVTANPGTIITIADPGEIELTGSDGGNIFLRIDSYSTGQTFVSSANPPNVNEVYVGGTIVIPNQATVSPGQYGGTFTLMFVHQ